MNPNKALAVAAFLAASIWSLNANTFRKHFQYDLAGNKFGAPEFRYEVFGTWRVLDEIAIGDGRLGVGVGVNYFFNLNWGVGVDTHLERLDFPNHLNASIIGRYPIQATFQSPVLEHRAGKPGELADRNVCPTKNSRQNSRPGFQSPPDLHPVLTFLTEQGARK